MKLVEAEVDDKLSDADLLDAVRRLRQYLSTMDNVHSALTSVALIDDPALVNMIKELQTIIPPMNIKVAMALRSIEANKQYRDMIKKYNIPESTEE